MADNERELVKRVLNGDEAAFLEIYNAHKHRLIRTAAHFLGSSDSGLEDVVQETFAAAIPKLKDFRFESSLYTWLNRFTVNFCFQAINKRKKTVLTETEVLEGVSAKRSRADAPPAVKAALREDIAALSEDHRIVIQLKDIEGRSYLEIAAKLKLAPGTVMSRLSRARAELKIRVNSRKKLYEAFWNDT